MGNTKPPKRLTGPHGSGPAMGRPPPSMWSEAPPSGRPMAVPMANTSRRAMPMPMPATDEPMAAAGADDRHERPRQRPRGRRGQHRLRFRRQRPPVDLRARRGEAPTPTTCPSPLCTGTATTTACTRTRFGARRRPRAPCPRRYTTPGSRRGGRRGRRGRGWARISRRWWAFCPPRTAPTTCHDTIDLGLRLSK
jgi:hypothetical protein